MKRLTTGLFCALLLQSALTTTLEARTHRPTSSAVQERVVENPTSPIPAFFNDLSTGFSRGYTTGSSLVDVARGYVGMKAKQIGVRATLWCSAFLRKITGRKDVDDRAKSWEKRPRIAPQVGAIVTMNRKRGGHVGLVSGFTAKGDPIVISGNSTGRKVTERVYPRSRIRAWVKP